MGCDKKQVLHWMNNQMSESEREAFETHLSGCADCRQEYETARHMMDLIERIPQPEPSPDMKIRFQGMLDAYKRSESEQSGPARGFLYHLQQLWVVQPAFKLAYVIILVLAGLVIGLYINNKGKSDNDNGQILALSNQVEEMRQLMMLSLVDNPSASKRLEAVSYTDGITRASDEIINALLTTLNEDDNVNVRLAALEALAKFSNLPKVREGLVKSITQQESPLVQAAMVDVMVKLQERNSVQPFRQLLNKKDLNQTVKVKIQNSIPQLI